MSLKDVISTTAAQQGISKAKTKRVVDSVLAAITANLSAGESFRFPGLGVFKVRDSSARVCRNPQTGGTIDIPARKVPKISFSKSVKDVVRNPPAITAVA